MPQNLRALSVSNSSIALGWSRPAMANGVVKGYRLYYMRHNFTDVVTVRQTGSNIEYELHDLGKEARKKGRMGDKIVRAVGILRENGKGAEQKDPPAHCPRVRRFV